MIIIEDTRQMVNAHDLKHLQFAKIGVELSRCALPFGDYALPPTISVDTKKDMGEIAMNLTSEHARFRRECERAQAAGCQLVILIENEDGINVIDDVHLWDNPRLAVSEKAITGERLEKVMKTMTHRYGVKFMFCRPLEAATKIMEILNGGNT